MSDQTESTCPKCGTPIPDDAPQNLCPKCVLAGISPTPATANTAATVLTNRTPPPTAEEVAEHFPELEIVEMIGAGGMGAVYKVRQPRLDRHVALKILSHDLAGDPAFVERFNREARVLARLNHPNIVTVFDFGTSGPYCYLLMEFVDGVNLRQAMRAGGFTPADSLALVRDLCGALTFAHEEGILHRDIKPENILIDSRGRVKIADFGIAKLIGDSSPSDVTLTMQGAILGSPQYMAPEQIETPGDVDQRADIYSLGVVFYELLTGELPLGRFAAPSEKSPMDPRIDEIVFRTLEKERQLRYQSASEFKTKVESVSQPVAAAAGGQPAAGTAAADPPGAEDALGAAKFSTASAILTGLGLVMSGVAFCTLPLFAMEAFRGSGSRQDFAIIALVMALVVGVLLLLGLVLGIKALGEIRLSGGRKSGFGSAMFGTLAVPVLLTTGCIAANVPMMARVIPAGEQPITLGLALAAALVGAICLMWLVRRLGSWARGASGGGVAAMASGGLVLVAAVMNLLALSLWSLPSGGRGNDPEPRHIAGGAEAKTGSTSSTGEAGSDQPRRELWDLHWGEGRPDQVVQVIVPAGNAATIELVRLSVPGEEFVDQRWSVLAADSQPFDGVVAIGAPAALQRRQQEGVAALQGSFWSNKGGAVHLLNKFYQGELLLRKGGGILDLSRQGVVGRELGQFQATAAPVADTFWLRVIDVARPDFGGSQAPADELFGTGSPAELVDAWRKLHPDEPDVDWTENHPEIELDFVAPAGRVTVFSLQAPWDREHESPDDWYVVAPEDRDYRGTIKIGSVGSTVGEGRKSVEVLATLHDAAGMARARHTFKLSGEMALMAPKTYSRFEVDEVPDGEVRGMQEQEFSGNLDVSQPGVHAFYFGLRADSQVEDTLRILAWSVARPDPDRAVEPEGGRIGPAGPPNVVDRWIQQRQKRLNEAKGALPEGEETIAVEGIGGAVLVRSGFLFDTRQRQLAGGAQLRQGESLLLRKGSEASLSLAPETSIKLGAPEEDSLVIFPQQDYWFVPPFAGLELETERWPGGRELVVGTAFGASLKVSGETLFHLSPQGRLEVLEGELEVVQEPGQKISRLSAGQEMTFPKPAFLDDTDPQAEPEPAAERPIGAASGSGLEQTKP